MRGHIDKLNKTDNCEGIEMLPPGHRQWEFICSVPEARESIIRNADIGVESAFVYITDRCRKNCTFCNRQKTDTLSIEAFERFVKEESQKKLQYVVLDGDPTADDDFERYVDILNRYKVQYSINSNSPLAADAIDYLKGTVSKIQFRVDSDITALKELLPCIDRCSETGIYTGVVYSGVPDDEKQLAEAIQMCEEHHVLQFSFSRMSFCPWDGREHRQFSSSDFLNISKKLIRLNGSFRMHITSNDANWKGCGAAVKTVCILPDGQVLPCAYLKLTAGNMITDPFDSAWNSPLFTELRRGVGKGKCGKCRYNLLCKGCRALAMQNTGDYMAEDNGCWVE
ncbi:MAG: SPASM domain-containing protein [Ruminococcus sp.]|nr:SPASM domain-containing protein [Ruminococcus sp.]